MAKFEYIEWLFFWLLETIVFEFEWDQGNSLKSFKKHDVSDQEVEEVFLSETKVPLGRQYQPDVSEERYCIVGKANNDRILSVVFTLRNGKVRAISGRPANRNERRVYEKSS